MRRSTNPGNFAPPRTRWQFRARLRSQDRSSVGARSGHVAASGVVVLIFVALLLPLIPQHGRHGDGCGESAMTMSPAPVRVGHRSFWYRLSSSIDDADGGIGAVANQRRLAVALAQRRIDDFADSLALSPAATCSGDRDTRSRWRGARCAAAISSHSSGETPDQTRPLRV